MIEIVTRVDEAGAAVVDTYDGRLVTFITEPSGVLVVFSAPGQVWAAYAPGEWKKVRDVPAD